MKQKLLTLLMAFIPMVMMAYDAKENGIYFNVVKNAKVATVTNSGIEGCYSGDVVIPSTIVFEGVTCNVTSIGDYAFGCCYDLTSVIIPEGVTSIGKGAFNSCYGLMSVTIPEGVTSIGEDAFGYCYGLTSVTIPSSVTSIGNVAFEGCSSLMSVTIPEGVTSIGDFAFDGTGLTSVIIPSSVTSIGEGPFEGCSDMTSITVDNDNSAFDSRDNCNAIIETTTNTLIQGCSTTVIPNTVTSIGNSAFYGCFNLKNVTIPSSVTNIARGAFSRCIYLTSIIVDEGNQIYDSRSDCNAIIETATNILIKGCNASFIPSSVTSIGIGAFSGCFNLTDVTIPEGVTSIGDYAFEYCPNLSSVTIPSSVSSIGDYAFFDSYLTEVSCNATTIPSTGCETFDSNIGSATLIVPDAALSDYQSTEPWSGFGTIQGSHGAESLSSNYIVVHMNTTGGNAAIGWSLSNDAFLLYCCPDHETIIQHISKIVIDDNEYSYLGDGLSCYGYDTSVEHTVKIYFDSPLTNIVEMFDNSYNIDFLDMSHFDASQIQQISNCILGMVSLDTWVMPANLNVDNCEKKTVTSRDNTALTNVFCPSDRLSDYQAFFVNTDTRVYNCLKADDSYYEEPDDVDDEGFRYIKEFTYVKDISDYTGSGVNASLTNATQHITETDILKANVFKVGQFYGRSEGQSYAHFHIYSDRNLDYFLGEFDFAWGWYSIGINEQMFSFVDAYDNMAIGDTQQITDSEGNTYTITVLGKGVEDGDEKLTFCCDRPIYFGGDGQGIVGIERFSNRVQIQYLRDISEIGGVDNPKPQQTIDLSEIPAMTYGDVAYALPEATNEGLIISWYSGNEEVVGVEGNALIVKGVGSTTITAVQEGNDTYQSFQKEYTVMVSPASLIIRADSYTIRKGDALPVFSFTCYGFVNNETVSDLTSQPTITCDAENTNTTGTFTIYISDAASDNYDIVYVEGKLVIKTIGESIHEYVDLGLPSGIMWATTNLGAATEEEVGDLFAWGETETKSNFTVENYVFSESVNEMTKYNEEDGLTTLEREDDAATVNWGDGWSIPTKEAWEELRDNCTRTWKTINGVSGSLFTAPNGNSIFLPCDFDNFWHNGAGRYWSSTLGSDVRGAYDVDFDMGGFYIDDYGADETNTMGGHRCTGQNIRPVYTGPTMVSLTIGSAGVCTFASPYDLNFANVTGVKAYVAGGFKPSTGRLVLLRADEVPAGTGLYIKGTPGTYNIPIQETDMLFVNFLVGVTEDTQVSPSTDTHKNYVLANGSYGVGFYPLSKTGTISAGKAYLSIPTSSGNASANFIGLEFEDEETTSITSAECLTPNDGFWYTLDGRKLDKKPTQKGVYIMKGQKVVIK